MPYLTPFSTPTITEVCRSLSIPEDYLPAVMGALLELTYLWNWEEISGESVDTPEEAVEKMVTMLDSMGACKMAVIGSIIPYLTEDPPAGTLPCSGFLYLGANYPELYAVLHSTYLVPPSSFRLPDLRGRSLIGEGTGAGLSARSMGASGGEEQVGLDIASIPEHAHDAVLNAYNLLGNNQQPINAVLAAWTGAYQYYTGAPSVEMQAGAVEIDDTGGDGDHENMHPFSVVGYCCVYE